VRELQSDQRKEGPEAKISSEKRKSKTDLKISERGEYIINTER